MGRRRARTINPRTVTAARIIKEYAQEHKWQFGICII